MGRQTIRLLILAVLFGPSGQGRAETHIVVDFGPYPSAQIAAHAEADLRGADLRGARIDGVDFYLVDLRDVKCTVDQCGRFHRCGTILYGRA